MITQIKKCAVFEVSLRTIIAAVLVLGLVGIGEAEEGKEKKIIKSEMKEVTGEVGGISKNFLAILYGQDKDASYEMALTIDKDVKLKGKNSLSEIGPGDTVSVSYEEKAETYKENDEKGKEKDVTKVLSRVVKAVTFIKSAPKELQAPEESVLISTE